MLQNHWVTADTKRETEAKTQWKEKWSSALLIEGSAVNETSCSNYKSNYQLVHKPYIILQNVNQCEKAWSRLQFFVMTRVKTWFVCHFYSLTFTDMHAHARTHMQTFVHLGVDGKIFHGNKLSMGLTLPSPARYHRHENTQIRWLRCEAMRNGRRLTSVACVLNLHPHPFTFANICFTLYCANSNWHSLRLFTPAARAASYPIASETQRHCNGQTDRASFHKAHHHHGPVAWRNPSPWQNHSWVTSLALKIAALRMLGPLFLST